MRGSLACASRKWSHVVVALSFRLLVVCRVDASGSVSVLATCETLSEGSTEEEIEGELN